MASEKGTLSPGTQLLNLLKLAGEVVIIPGTSLLMQGKVPQGGAHAILGFIAKTALGPVAGTVCWLVLAANSYSKSTSGAYLHDHVVGAAVGSDQPEEVLDVDVTTAPAGKAKAAGRA